MKELFTVAALLAVAVCAFLFPEMKKALLLIPLVLAALAVFNGCANPAFQKHIRALPDGEFSNFSFVETGKFTNTKLEGERLVKDGDKISATKIHAQHNNAWIPNLEFKADSWVLDLSRGRARVPKFSDVPSSAQASPRTNL